jgi:23S rRNA (guanine2445-N2)-methyltransferase / 23S rRNA (guanine2069-N7)-methyltransferase
MSDHYELFLTCPKSLEGLLAEEAVRLGLQDVREQVAAVRGQGDLETAYRLCLWSRLANRVLLVLKRFPVRDAEELYQGVLEWLGHR